LLIFLFFLIFCRPIIAETAEKDGLYEAPEIVVYGEGFISLDKGAFVYVLADTKIMRPIIDIIPVNQLKSWQAAQVIDRTEIALAALFTSGTGRFFQITGFGSYPNLIVNVALAIDKNWRYTFSEKDHYWYSDKDRLSVSLNSEEIFIAGWRRTRINPVYEEPGIKMPEGFAAFRRRSGEPAPLSLWMENHDSILDRMLSGEGIAINFPIERLYLNLYPIENNAFKADLLLQTDSLSIPEKLEINLSESEESVSPLKTFFFSNTPVQNERNVEFQPVLLSEEEISSLLKIFMKNWK
jgi:hypothetical protein